MLDCVVICQFSKTTSSNNISTNSSTQPPQSISTTKSGKNSISTTSSSSVGPMSKIADISRKLASLGIILNNAEDSEMNAKLNDTLETVEQLLESLESPTEERKTFAEETIHTRPLIGTAMRIINVYEAIFCVLAASLLLLVIIFH